jgi:hypothetical protein
MKSKIFLFLTGILFMACTSYAQNYKTISKDAKPAFTLTPKELESAAADAAKASAMNNKVVEIKGKVIKTYSIGAAGDRSKGTHYINIEVPNEADPYMSSYITCFFGTSQAALMGKEVTVKGEFLKKGSYSCLWHCVAITN